MTRLLNAGFFRLRRDRTFWITAAVVILISLVNVPNSTESWQVQTAGSLAVTMEEFFFNLAPYAGMIFAVFVSLFLGTEHSDGTIRNKLVVGHTRRHIYLADFAVCFAADLFLLALWILGQTPLFFTIGPMEMGMTGFAAYLAVAVCFTASLTAVFVLINMLSTNKAVSVVLSLAVWILLILAASGANDRLDCPATIGGMAYIDGEFVMMEEKPNPLYVAGFARLLLKSFLDLLPTGPAILMTNAAIENPGREITLALLLTALLIFAGVRLFQKKNLR